jgi:hypothetical protein
MALPLPCRRSDRQLPTSVDGFSGLTKGSVLATWTNDGEQHVLAADFVLNAIMDDARAER